MLCIGGESVKSEKGITGHLDTCMVKVSSSVGGCPLRFIKYAHENGISLPNLEKPSFVYFPGERILGCFT